MRNDALTRWTTENAADLYGIRGWGAGYFDVATNGDVVVRPNGPRGDTEISLMDLVAASRERGLNMPVLVRFSNILSSRIQEINESFRKAIAKLGYKGKYRGVYPIKVNQLSDVVEDITRAGAAYHHGLEAGSKAELTAALSYMDDPEAFIICNGYKDEEFIDLALHAQKTGMRIVIVLEMPSEIELVLQRAEVLKVKPCLGVRAKLSSRVGGHWDSSGGDRSKFGLDAAQIVDLVDNLRQRGMLDCLRLLHYHLGSQIPDIRKVRMGLHEACRFYVDLVREGAPMGTLNMGGGLAVDYDGSHTNFECSTNYTPHEYAADVIEVVMHALDAAGIAHPTLISESGRATVAYSSVLIFNVLHARRFEPQSVPARLAPDSCQALENIMEVCRTLSPRNVQEAYHDAVFYRDEIRQRFLNGDVSLRERAVGESIFLHIICQIANSIRGRKYIPDEMEDLDAAIADTYYGNFSLFQSIPDYWGVNQLFPIMPIHRLQQRPARKGILADITCDSDGRIDRFIDLHDVKAVLPLHDLVQGKEYYLGIFLVGAYQETIGDMHNLFGNTNVLHVHIAEDGTIAHAKTIAGDSVEEILRYMEYNPRAITQTMKRRLARARTAGLITAIEARDSLAAYKASIAGYTYFEK